MLDHYFPEPGSLVLVDGRSANRTVAQAHRVGGNMFAQGCAVIGFQVPWWWRRSIALRGRS